MKVFVGVDLGSTTTKAVVMTDREEILGRGITNSRSNYDVACALARSEAFTTARFALLRREIGAEADSSALADRVVPELERGFRREQHTRQLEALREASFASLRDEGLREPLEEVFDGMRETARGLFSGENGDGAARSDFFRDIAASQYLKLAETVARRRKVRFDRLMSLFDKAILIVENDPPDLSFESNIRAAADQAMTSEAIPAGPAQEKLAAVTGRIAKTPLEESAAVGTGYGRARLPFPKEWIRSEILCHGLGAHYFFPDTATVLDIGGQDTKAIQVDSKGIVTSFQMNDRCAAGCGRYLGYIADEMNLGLHELGPLAQKSCRPTRIASTCTVFAGAELRDRLSLGEKREDILAGLHRAIILRAMSLLARSGGVKEQFTFTGGVARNPAALEALERLIQENYGQRTLNVSADSIYTGAVGAALFAKRADGQAEAA
jgi:benzoyl-CoA reductase subunit A